ncbi:PREDICTED: geranylgeranyl pyrophosphate synthase-like [Vollenhovia emeryi]|uniref:geranylgeranyl pyrophosphate synthase-like n=1 Tax=Vollenhovia emeryi TaxID=411798 RepID=UPI0005F58D3B|nr:PREDICTED: geranylgeranyl pyrophosphate synthase-like [Vollenhovia emeryi]XP_011876892.1 PREDICTED: geranylgeranyl pyrophosphate synthase-like [Vollenhovia emeryi]XP_011876893.1 PREDICTED: geranylgeranyl pyrophosphate synthase-like [Vollenhovia emeryi]
MFTLQHAILRRLSNVSTFYIIRNIHSHLVLRKEYTTNKNDMTNTNHSIPFYYSTSSDREENEILLEPVRYILQVPGKQVRTNLIKAFNYWLRIPDDKLQTIDNVTTMIHTSTVMIDDIQDNSNLRRGIPVTHSIYGLPDTINAANYVSFVALERIINLLHPKAVKVYMEQVLEFYRGQGTEVFSRINLICPTEADYKAVAIKKGGIIIHLVLKLMQLVSTYEEDFSLLTNTFKVWYQIRDDYCNLCLDEYTNQKGYCEDLTEGKFSFPIIHALTHNPDDKEIISILKQPTKDDEIKRYCVQLLEKYGSLEYTRNVIKELDSIMRTEIQRLGGNPPFVRLLDQLDNWDNKNVPKNHLAGTS